MQEVYFVIGHTSYVVGNYLTKMPHADRCQLLYTVNSLDKNICSMVCTEEPNQRKILPPPYPTLWCNIFILYNLWVQSPGFNADFLWNNLYKDSMKFYFVKNLYITKPYHDHRSVYYRDSSLKLILWVVALVSDRNGPCHGCLLICTVLVYCIGPISINTLISM
jgi:hypothetical protein